MSLATASRLQQIVKQLLNNWVCLTIQLKMMNRMARVTILHIAILKAISLKSILVGPTQAHVHPVTSAYACQVAKKEMLTKITLRLSNRDLTLIYNHYHGCQTAIAVFLNRMCLALRASGLWLRYATLQNLIPSFPWIAPPCPPPWHNPRKGRDQILPSGNTKPHCRVQILSDDDVLTTYMEAGRVTDLIRPSDSFAALGACGER